MGCLDLPEFPEDLTGNTVDLPVFVGPLVLLQGFHHTVRRSPEIPYRGVKRHIVQNGLAGHEIPLLKPHGVLLILVEKDHGKARVGNHAVVMRSASRAYGLPRRERRALEKLESLRLGDASRLLIENGLLGRILRLTRKRGGLGVRGGYARRSGACLVLFRFFEFIKQAHSLFLPCTVNR